MVDPPVDETRTIRLGDRLGDAATVVHSGERTRVGRRGHPRRVDLSGTELHDTEAE